MRNLKWLVMGCGVVWAMATGCGDDDDAAALERPDLTGAMCEVPDDCYPDADHDALAGDVRCLDRVRGGYCTHECDVDGDCCAEEGTCESDFDQVCSPFESTGLRMCFLSCEREDLREFDGEREDEQEYCQRGAGPEFVCRSSGGGAANRKVCVPGDCGVGATCVEDEDCEAGLRCDGRFDGGYCTREAECEADADCPTGSACAAFDSGNLCLKRCDAQFDCSFCRGERWAATCSDEVPLVENDGRSVCDPR